MITPTEVKEKLKSDNLYIMMSSTKDSSRGLIIKLSLDVSENIVLTYRIVMNMGTVKIMDTTMSVNEFIPISQFSSVPIYLCEALVRFKARYDAWLKGDAIYKALIINDENFNSKEWS